MIKSKILYGLCIAALGLPFAEASKEMPNGMNDNKAIKSPRYGNEQHIKEAKKLVRSNDQMMDRSGNENCGRAPCYTRASQPNPNQQQRNAFVQGNFNSNLNMTRNNNPMMNGIVNGNCGRVPCYTRASQPNPNQQQRNAFVQGNFNNNLNMTRNNNPMMNGFVNGNVCIAPGCVQASQPNSGLNQCNPNMIRTNNQQANGLVNKNGFVIPSNNPNMIRNNNQVMNGGVIPGYRQAPQQNPGLNQYVVPSYGKYGRSYCNLEPKLPGVSVNGNLHSGDEIEIIACVLNLVSVDYNHAASILNILAESKLKSLEFLNEKKYSESIIQNITRAVGRQNTYGLLNYTQNGNNKLQMIKSIMNGKSLLHDIVSMKRDGSEYFEYQKRKIKGLAVSANAELKKLDKSKDCNLFNNMPKVKIQHDGKTHTLGFNIVKSAVYLRNVKMLSRENIVKVLSLVSGKPCDLTILDYIYTCVGADKIWRRDIIDAISSSQKSIREFLVFKKKRRDLNVKDVPDEAFVRGLKQDIETYQCDVVKNRLYYGNDFTAEQIKTIKFLSSTGLKDAEVVGVFNRLFKGGKLFNINDIFDSNICGVIAREYSSKNKDVYFFYEIDDWLYLTGSDKSIIKTELLQCETTWEKVAKFLFGVCLFDRENTLRIVGDTFLRCTCHQETNASLITTNWQPDKMFNHITNENLVLDLASLGVLKEICSHIDNNKKGALKARFKSWIDKMPNGVEKNAFINKLGGYDLGILSECANKDGMEIEVVCKYDFNKVHYTNEQNKINEYLQTLNLPDEMRWKILNIIFYNDFHKIDELLYLENETKDDIKKKLLELTIVAQEAAKFLFEKKLFNDTFGDEEITAIVDNAFRANGVNDFKNYIDTNISEWKRKKMPIGINIEDIVLDLASLGLLEEIGLRIDENKKATFKDSFKSWIDTIDDEYEKNAFIKKLGGYDLGILGECVSEDGNNNGKDGMEMEDSETEIDEGYPTRTNGKKKVIEIEDDETEVVDKEDYTKEDDETEEMEKEDYMTEDDETEKMEIE